jgi:MFS family permease
MKSLNNLQKVLYEIPTSTKTLLLFKFITSLSWFMVNPYLGVYFSREKGFSYNEVGFLLGVAPLASLAFSIVGAKLADILGEKQVLLLTYLVSAFCILSYGFLDNFYILLFMRIIFGGCWAIQNIVNKTLLTNSVDETLLTKIFSYEYWLFNIGGAIGPYIGVRLASNSISLPLYVFVVTLIFLFIVFSYLFYKADLFRSSHGTINLPRNKTVKTQETSNKKNHILFIFIFIFIANFSGQFIESQYKSNISQFLDKNFNNGLKIYANIILINSIIIILFQPFIFSFTKKIDSNILLLIGTTLFGITPLFFIFANTNIMWYILVTIQSFGEIILVPIMQSMLTKITSRRNRSTYFSYMTISSNSANFLGPILGAIVITYGGKYLFVLLFFFGILLIITSSIASMKLKYIELR